MLRYIICSAIVTPVLLWHFLPRNQDPYGISDIPGPYLAKFTDVWLGFTAHRGHRSETIHQLHVKHGPMVRIAPNHVSISDHKAIEAIYIDSGALKSSYYDALASWKPHLYTIRDRDEHARKHEMISKIFSQRSVLDLEPHISKHIGSLIAQWDRLYKSALRGESGKAGGGWRGHSGKLWIDLRPWINYLIFDTSGDLAFGAPYYMLNKASDDAKIAEDPLNVFDEHGEIFATIGCLTGFWRTVFRYLFIWFGRIQKDTSLLDAVLKRLDSKPTNTVNLLSKLQKVEDTDGNTLNEDELAAEALSFMTGGSSTMSNSVCAILYYLAGNPRVQHKLRGHLDERLRSPASNVLTAEQVQGLPYLDCCINEGLRVHTTVGVGLPRVVPEGGLHISGRFFPAGTIVSVPSYTIHRDKAVWGEDAEVYRPERWEQRDQTAMQHEFIPFSVGPCACAGKNLATLQLQLIIGTLMGRYEFELEDPNLPLRTRDGLARKPLECKVGIRRRDSLISSNRLHCGQEVISPRHSMDLGCTLSC